MGIDSGKVILIGMPAELDDGVQLLAEWQDRETTVHISLTDFNKEEPSRRDFDYPAGKLECAGMAVTVNQELADLVNQELKTLA